MLTTASVMTPNPITVSGETLLQKAQEIMIKRGLRHLPVVENTAVTGIISDRDILLAQLAHTGLDDADDLTVSDISSLSVFHVSPQTPLAETVKLMAEKQIGSVLVMEASELLGIFTMTDACKVLSQQLQPQAEPSADQC